jgi:hypothetical protein
MAILASIVLVVAGLCAAFALNCSDIVAADVPSPTGDYVAIDAYVGCGGAAGSTHREVRLRRVQDGRTQTLATFLSGPQPILLWKDGTHLAIVGGRMLSRPVYQFDGVIVDYR